MSQGAYYLGGGETCNSYNTSELADAFERGITQCSPSAERYNTEGLQNKDLFSSQLEDHVEDQFILEIAKQESTELLCASEYSKSLLTNNVEAEHTLDNIHQNIKEFIQIRKRLGEVTVAHLQDTSVMAKQCPTNLGELDEVFNPEGIQSAYIEYCDQTIKLRIAKELILSNIPFSSLNGPIKDMINNVNDPDSDDLKDIIKKSYEDMSHRLISDKSHLDNIINTQGADGFGRAERRLLFSDPRLVENLITKSSIPNDMRELACRMDSRYGRGARSLDLQLGIGSLAVGGAIGITAKVISRGAVLARGVTAARAGGAFSSSAAKSLRIAALTGVLATDGLLAVSEIQNACFNNLNIRTRSNASNGKECLSTPTFNDTQNNQCILSATLNAIGIITGSSGVIHLSRMQNQLRRLETARVDAEAAQYVDNITEYERGLRSNSINTERFDVLQTELKDNMIELRDLVRSGDIVLDTSSNARARSRAIAMKMIEALNEKGIAAEVKLLEGRNTYVVLLKDVGDNQDLVLGNLAPAQNTLGMQYYIDPMLDIEGSGATYERAHNSIMFSYGDSLGLLERPLENIPLARQQVRYALQIQRHEINHLSLDRRLREGIDGDYYANVTHPTDEGLDIYQDYYSFEELSTYHKDLIVYDRIDRSALALTPQTPDSAIIAQNAREASVGSAQTLRNIALSSIRITDEALEVVSNTRDMDTSSLVFTTVGINKVARIQFPGTDQVMNVTLVRQANSSREVLIDELNIYLERLNAVATRRLVDANTALIE
jgi:hypothetical protein